MLICGKKNLESGGWRLAAGFTLIEALIAVGVLGMGLILIAMVFPVGIKLTATAVERSLGTLAANEAIAKVQLWGLPEDPTTWPVTDAATFPHTECVDFLMLVNLKYAAAAGWPKNDAWDEFLYPSAATTEPQRYHWSALCRVTSATQVQVTAFATRKVDEAARYYTPAGGQDGNWPQPVKVAVRYDPANEKHLEILPDNGNEKWDTPFDQRVVFRFFGGNATIINDQTGAVHPLMDYIDVKAPAGERDTLVLINKWTNEMVAAPRIESIWVIPPAVGSTRNPVVRVVQTTIVLP